jgi:hypothetical protein
MDALAHQSGSGPGVRTRDGCSVELYRSLPYRGDLDGVGLVTEMTLRYEISNQAWRHSFHASPLSESEIEELFAEAGFHGCEWFGPKRTWVRAIAS